MNKSDIIKKVQEATPELTQSQVRDVLDNLTKVATEELKRKRDFSFPGLVKIVVASTPQRAERTGRNPSTGSVITIPAKPAGKKLKARFPRRLKIEVGQLR